MLINSAIQLSEYEVLYCCGVSHLVYGDIQLENITILELKGLRSELREPVYAFANNDTIVVCDWRGQRVIAFDKSGNIKYQIKNSITTLLKLQQGLKRTIRYLVLKGSFLKSHFIETEPYVRSFLGLKDIIKVATELFYDHAALRLPLLKPNGVTIVETNGQEILYVVDKDLSLIYKIYLSDDLKEFQSVELSGRLGNLVYNNDLLYVCSETEKRIYLIDLDLSIKKTVDTAGLAPFGICALNNVIYFCTHEAVYRLDNDKIVKVVKYTNVELHGVFAFNDELFVVDRYNGRILNAK